MPTALYYLHDPFAPEPNKAPRLGSAVVIMADGKILLEHRKDNFHWGIVSGDIHNAESFRHCAIRTAIEETGIHLKNEQLHELKLFDDPTRIVSYLEGNIYRMISVGFYADLFAIPETVCGDESLELRWVDPMELDRYHIIPTHIEILEEFFRKTKKSCKLDLNIFRRS
ncbi:MAG: NUDIX domain-containing protein [Solobacterium sp.]|nr:NUDIX domain-containing protein [Solobacterium sp.]